MDQPYTYDGPIAERSRFYGRRSEITRISSRIGADRPQSVSVVGQPKSGKTSLLNWLTHPDSRGEYLDDPSAHVFLYLDLKEAAPQDPEGFFRAVDQACQAVGLLAMAHSYDAFSARIAELANARKHLVLFCDDFHVITQNQGFPLEFYSFLRSVANNNDVGYVVSSSAPLHKLCASPDLEESPFFNIFTPVNLRPLKDDESRALVVDRAEVAGLPVGPEAEWILELAGGHPYLLQLTATMAYRARSKGELTRSRLAERAVAEAETYFHMLCDTFLSPVQKDVLRLLAKGRPVVERFHYAAEDLVRNGFLAKVDDHYEFRQLLFREFVICCEKRSVWKWLLGRRTS